MAHKKVVIVGEVWSPNLGDRIIADTLAFLLQQVDPVLEVGMLDLSGRSPGVSGKEIEFKGIKEFISRQDLIKDLRNIATFLRTYGSNRRAWSRKFSDADWVIIGGGQLLAGRTLYFPLKIWQAAKIAHNQGTDIYITACGVGDRWTPWARFIFRRALHLSKRISVRDPYSREMLLKYIPGLKVKLSSDPALWAREYYGKGAEVRKATIGLGVLNHYHLNAAGFVDISEDDLIHFWLDLGAELVQRGFQVELFTNGGQRDFLLARKIHSLVSPYQKPAFSLAPRPTEPADLANQISGYSAILASRLHAHIISTSYEIPSLALVYDRKVASFFKDTGREHLLFYDTSDRAQMDMIEMLQKYSGKSVDHAKVRRHKALIMEDLRNIIYGED